MIEVVNPVAFQTQPALQKTAPLLWLPAPLNSLYPRPGPELGGPPTVTTTGNQQAPQPLSSCPEQLSWAYIFNMPQRRQKPPTQRAGETPAPNPPVAKVWRGRGRNPRCSHNNSLSRHTGMLGQREESAVRVSSPISLFRGDKYLLFLLWMRSLFSIIFSKWLLLEIGKLLIFVHLFCDCLPYWTLIISNRFSVQFSHRKKKFRWCDKTDKPPEISHCSICSEMCKNQDRNKIPLAFHASQLFPPSPPPTFQCPSTPPTPWERPLPRVVKRVWNSDSESRLLGQTIKPQAFLDCQVEGRSPSWEDRPRAGLAL